MALLLPNGSVVIPQAKTASTYVVRVEMTFPSSPEHQWAALSTGIKCLANLAGAPQVRMGDANAPGWHDPPAPTPEDAIGLAKALIESGMNEREAAIRAMWLLERYAMTPRQPQTSPSPASPLPPPSPPTP